jgi:hypothetical protein
MQNEFVRYSDTRRKKFTMEYRNNKKACKVSAGFFVNYTDRIYFLNFLEDNPSPSNPRLRRSIEVGSGTGKPIS